MSIVALYAVIIPFFVCVPLVLGIYVYRDARGRGMPPLLWGLVAALAPTFLGLLIYLLVRGSYSNLQCPRCGGRVEESFVVCPQCGSKLKASCPVCGGAVEAGWKVCPQCAQPLGLETQEVTPPVKPQDKGLWKVLLVVILIPVAFLVVLTLSFSAANSAGVTHTAYHEEGDLIMKANDLGMLSLADGLRDQGEEDLSTIYVLASYREVGAETTRYSYLIYLPQVKADSVTSGHSVNLLGSRVKIAYEREEGKKGVFFSVTSFQAREPDIQIKRDGMTLPVHFIHVPERDLSQFTYVQVETP